jgi:hypothetical protein
MLVLSSTVASRYYNYCVDGSISPGSYGYHPRLLHEPYHFVFLNLVILIVCDLINHTNHEPPQILSQSSCYSVFAPNIHLKTTLRVCPSLRVLNHASRLYDSCKVLVLYTQASAVTITILTL